MAKWRRDARAMLGIPLRARREDPGLSQEAVGERTGLAGKNVSEIERAHSDPPFAALDWIVSDGLGAGLAAPAVSLAGKQPVEVLDGDLVSREP
jgi:transcriptional regulator with XRE-family HTH domain